MSSQYANLYSDTQLYVYTPFPLLNEIITNIDYFLNLLGNCCNHHGFTYICSTFHDTSSTSMGWLSDSGGLCILSRLLYRSNVKFVYTTSAAVQYFLVSNNGVEFNVYNMPQMIQNLKVNEIRLYPSLTILDHLHLGFHLHFDSVDRQIRTFGVL